ncbi:sacsin-like [Lepisosteus oculatus]|uniref:sacsin-like n=1 Tax=Lepisosteus oculatus TaxID=7918 RepID=UPI0035F5277D
MPRKRTFRARAPPFIEYLKDVLRRYPDGGQILKELIQNADDAKATEVIFVYDERDYPCENLWDSTLCNFQGPALLAYNNAVFTEEDWSGIVAAGQSVKKEDPHKIGRFGIGFHSIYHITDLPWIFSGTNIGVLDPQEVYLEEGGWWSLEDELDRKQLCDHPDQFEPLRKALEEISKQTSWAALLLGETFKGTLFRFPLRTEASQISDTLYDREKVFDLFKSFKGDAEMSLLFLKNVVSISLMHISPDGKVTNHLNVKASHDREGQVRIRSEELSLLSEAESSCGLKVISSQDLNLEANRRVWLVSSFTARNEQNSSLDRLAEKLKYRPCIGLAFPLTDTAERLKGRLSCFLPLPDNDTNTTGLPVHVNACFGLTDNRREIKWLEKDQQHDEAAQWNEILVNQLLPPAYCQTILCAIDLALTGNTPMKSRLTYNLWPDMDSLVTQDRWQKIGTMVTRLLSEYKVLFSANSNTERLRPTEAVFPLSCEDHIIMGAVEHLLLSQREPLVRVPDHVYNSLKSVLQGRLTQGTPEFLCRLLGSCDLSPIPGGQRILLLEFILKGNYHQGLEGLQLLPLNDGSFTRFLPSGRGENVFIDSKEFPRTLLPGLDKNFLPKNLRPGLNDLLCQLASKNIFNIYHLNAKEVIKCMRESLPRDWTAGSDHVIWNKRNPSHPPAKWLSKLWNFITKHCGDLQPFEGLPLIPLERLSNAGDTVKLVRLTRCTTLVFQSLNDYVLKEQMVKIIEKLGGTVIKQLNDFLVHQHLNSYVLYPSVGNLLKILSHIGETDVKKKLNCLTVEEKNKLRCFLSKATHLTEKESQFISELPIFQKTPSLTSSGQGFVEAKSFAAIKYETIPRIPDDLVLRETVLKCVAEYDQILFGLLKVRLLSSADVALQIVSGIERKHYVEYHNIETMMKWVLKNYGLLYNQSSVLQKKCKTLRFLNKGGTWVEPAALFDPEEGILKELFSKDLFPQKPFAEKSILKTLRILGLRSTLDSILPEEFLAVAQELEKENNTQAFRKSELLVKICNETDILSTFSGSQLKTLRSVPWVCAEKSAGKKPCKWYKPQELKHSILGHLVELVMPLTNKFNQKASQYLEITKPPPAEKVIENLKKLAETFELTDPDVIETKVKAIYTHVQENLSDFTSLLQGCPIWNGSGFSNPKEIVLDYPKELDLSYCIQKVPDELSKKYSSLLMKCGIKSSLSPKEIVDLLSDLKNNIDSHTVSAGPVELKFAISVLEWMRTSRQDFRQLGCEKNLLVPVHNHTKENGFCLQPLYKALFPDITSEALEDLCEDEGEYYVVHKEVSRATADYFNVPFLSTRVLKPEFIGIEQYGQTEPIPLRIKNILKEYDEESDLFKELIQNAEDAKATVCSFLVDMRQNKELAENLIDPGMSFCHGPALWSYNNEVFTEEDFENITRLGSASKETQVEKIGKFGLGFNAVYHITDIPSILSGTTLIIFDPNVTHLKKHIQSKSNPGIKLDLSKHNRLLARFPGQFEPYQDIFGCNISDHPFQYKGTLIKLPFRTAAEAQRSEISTKIYDEDRISTLVRTFRENCEHMLLFLKRVQNVSIKVLSPTSSTKNHSETSALLTLTSSNVCGFEVSGDIQMRQLQQASLRRLEEFKVKCRGITDVNILVVKEITLDDPNAVKVSQYWLVYSCFGTGRALNMVCDPTQTQPFALPLGSVAVPLSRSPENDKWKPNSDATVGQVFCFLPLAIHSGLPVHINGFFCVTSNRKNLWNTGMKGEWNRALLQDTVTAAYITVLLQLQKMSQGHKLVDYDYFSFWPNMDKVLEPFRVTAETFYQAVAKGFCGRPLRLLSNGDQWCSIENARFLDPEIARHKSIGKGAAAEFSHRLQQPLLPILLPEWVRKGFAESGCSDIIEKRTYNWKQFYSEVIFGNLERMDATTRNSFVLHAIDMRNPDIDDLLKTTACIPTSKSGTLGLELIGNLIHPKGKVASLFENEEGRIPTGSQKDFLHPDRLARLEALGMVKDQISVSELIQRAETIQYLWHQDKGKACKRIQSILTFLSNLKINNADQEKIQNIAFLPAVPPYSPENIVEENVCLMPAKMVYKTKHKWLVNMTEPIFAKNQLDSDFKLSSEASNVLGLNKKPPTEKVLSQLKKTFLFQDRIQKTETEQIAKKCYSYLCESLKSQTNNTKKILAANLTFPFIYIDGKFVKTNEVAHLIPFDATPYLYKLPIEYKEFDELWSTVGIKENFHFSDYSSILQRLSQKYGKSALQKHDFELCLRVINTGLGGLVEELDFDSYDVQSLMLPDQKNVLQSSDKLQFNDSAWLKLDEDIVLCHSRIPREIAVNLGIPTTKHKALTGLRVCQLSRWVKSFGAHEKLTKRLQNIIKEYPSNKDILKELIQNADDAKATEIHFIWDQRQHPLEKIFGDEWAEVQGPSLCVYNNKKFTEDDVKGIQELGEGGKAKNVEKTGKFGLGFNSVYHLTDCPSFISGDSRLCVFDPHISYLKMATERDPGGEFAINKSFKSTFPDVYNAYLPSFYELEKGTMFRIPLRTEEMARNSDIKKEAVTEEDMRCLIKTLEEDPDGLMLFLNNITKITFQTLDSTTQQLQPVFSVEVKMSEDNLKKRIDFLNKVQEIADLQTEVTDINPFQVFMEVEIHCTGKCPTKWILAKQVGFEEKEIKASAQHICEKLRQKLIPHGAIAASANSLTKGVLFCSLPLPVETGLPVHVNGSFAVNSSRRDLWKEDGQNVKTEWNESIKLNLLAPLYSDLLLYIANHLFNDKERPLTFRNEKHCEEQLKPLFCIFPKDFDRIQKDWYEVVARVYRSIHAKKYKVIPIFRREERVAGLYGEKYISIDWSSVGNETTDEPHFMTEKYSSDLIDVLKQMKMKFVLQSDELTAIWNEFVKAGSRVTELNPQSVRKFLMAHPLLNQQDRLALPLNTSPFKNQRQICTLLEYCLRDITEENVKHLEGLPLLLTQDDTLRRFLLAEPKYLSLYHNLFPGMDHLFANISNHFEMSALEKAGFLKKFTVQDSVNYIKARLVHSVSNDDCKTWPVLKQEDEKWIHLLWKFFGVMFPCSYSTDAAKKEEMFMELKSLFGDLAILPVLNTKEKCNILVSLNALENVVRDEDIGKLLIKLGFAKFDSMILPHDIMFHVIRPNVLNTTDSSTTLKKLSESKGLQWTELSALEHDNLLDFLLNGLQNTTDSQMYMTRLKSLPVFQTMQGSHKSIDKFKKVYILNSVTHFPDLYEIDSEVIFLKNTSFNNKLSENSDIKVLTDLQFFSVVILQKIEELSESQKLSSINLLLCIIHHYPIEYDKNKSKIITALKPVKFIRDVHGNLREASFFYDKNVHLFKTMNLNEKFIPQEFFKNLQPGYLLQQLLGDLGMRHTPSQDDILHFATLIERDAKTGAQVKELKPKVDAVLKTIFLFQEDLITADFCEKLSTIKFVYSLEVKRDLCDLHAPYVRNNQLIALKGSFVTQKDDDVELVWTAMPILPFQQTSAILKNTGALYVPPQDLVFQNLRNLAGSECKTEELIQTRAKVIETAYQFLQKCRFDSRSLSDIPIILVENNRRLVKPNKVVISLVNENDFRPYLYPVSPLLAPYKDLFQKMGVSVQATTSHFARVLREIFEDSKMMNSLQPRQIKASKRAVQHFFKGLEKDHHFQSTEGLYLPAMDGKLHESGSLYYNDCVNFTSSSDVAYWKEKFKIIIKLKECHLQWDIYRIRKCLKLLPEEMRPKMLSETTEEALARSALKLCQFGEQCEFRQHLENLLKSTNFSEGVISALKWQYKGDLPQAISRNGLKELFSEIQITCCEKLVTGLFYNSTLLEKSTKKKEVYISKHKDQCDIFVEHQNNCQGRRILKVPKALAQEINVMLHELLNDKTIPILIEMLCCEDAEDIPNVLMENDIHISRSETDTFNLPSPGEVIPDDFLNFLEMDFLSTFEMEDFVGYLDSDGVYRYAVIVQNLGIREESDGTVEWYMIEIGDKKVIKVSKNDIYQFKRTKGTRNNCKELMLLTQADEMGNIHGGKFSQSIEDIKKEIDECFEKIAKLPKQEREKAIRRLYLKWHPDKNPEDSEIATEVCKYIQQLKANRKSSQKSTGSTYHSYDWYSWDAEASKHKKGKTNFNFRYPSHEYDFFSFHSRYRPNPTEARRWLKQAEHDLSSADRDAGQSNTEWVFFKVHQAVEKALIAAQYKRDGRYSKGQTISSMAQNVSLFSESLRELSDLVHRLTGFDVDNKKTQYPTYHTAPNIPNGQFPPEKEQEVLSLGRSVLDKIQDYISS